MKKIMACLFSVLPALTLAGANPYESLYFSGKGPQLTTQEKDALAIYQKWAHRKGNRPINRGDGTVQYLYGVQQPTIVCSPLNICDLALQPGEKITGNLNIGDPRWRPSPSLSGHPGNQTVHIALKPTDVGLETNLMITTDRRTYHIQLKSDRTRYMPTVSFIYPQAAQAKWAAIKNRQYQDKEKATLPENHEYLGNLSFAYAIDGDVSWKPLRVYNDGKKTIIDLPKTLEQKEAPVLMMVTKEGGWFSDDKTAMVNYRVQHDRYIVDAVFDKAILIAGVGEGQQKVTITREQNHD
jgi:P-type conjugative transfer protein TrbG